MKIATIHGELMTSRSAAHEHIAEALDFPLYYGKNLDALADCLSELPRDTVIIFSELDRARREIGEYVDRILEVFEEFGEIELLGDSAAIFEKR